jgi:hypothetical protein
MNKIRHPEKENWLLTGTMHRNREKIKIKFVRIIIFNLKKNH